MERLVYFMEYLRGIGRFTSTTQTSRLVERKNRFQAILIAFILLLFATLYAKADYTNYWESPQDIWDKVWYVAEGFLFLLFSIYGVLSNNDIKYKWSWRILATFFLLRWIWECKAVMTGASPNEKKAVAILFTINSVAIFLITYLPFIIQKWHRLK